jgi:hypothetical protein
MFADYLHVSIPDFLKRCVVILLQNGGLTLLQNAHELYSDQIASLFSAKITANDQIN